MRWAKVAVALGLLLVVAGFCLGVDNPISTTVAGGVAQCDNVIAPGALVSGQSSGPDTRTAAERTLAAKVDAACAPLEHRAAWVVRGCLGVGGLVLVAGWTVLREREDDRSSAEAAAMATS